MTYLTVTSTILGVLLPVSAMAEAIHTAKSPYCGCCTTWVEYMSMNGHDMTIEDMEESSLHALKVYLGIPEEVMSCHTARVDGFVIEGHVPAPDVERLLVERPDAIGLAVPGMPLGSPGMGSREGGEAFDVMLVRKDGLIEVFASYPALE